MDQYELPEPKFFTHAMTGTWKRLIVSCQPDRCKGEIWVTKLCVHTVAKLGKVIKNYAAGWFLIR